MNKQIPIYFDSVIVASPIEKISDINPNLGRLQVGVFTKYGNRNGSYITDEVADQLIQSAIQGNTPVVGFFDPQNQVWASHTGPTLASGYGYVEDFIGWKPLQDTDGVTREYAVFSVVVFTNYFEEAKTIVGQNQSMELDVNSITGDWANIEDTEYYVYTTAKIMGLCIIGSHEPCFSASSFFSKNDDKYANQYEKFEKLLFDLKESVSNLEIHNKKGGEQPMVELEEVLEAPTEEISAEEVPAENAQFEESAKPAGEEEMVETTEEVESIEEVEAPETTEDTSDVKEAFEAQPVEPETPVDEESQPTEFEILQASFDELTVNYNKAQETIVELNNKQNETADNLASAIATIRALEEKVAQYEAKIEEIEKEKKEALIEKYTKILEEEEITPIRNSLNDYSYDEINSKLAISFANKKLTDTEAEPVVPQPDVPADSFALFMEKYRKH